MAEYVFKGYRNKATVYEWESAEGKRFVTTSNAARYEDAITAAKLAPTTKLVAATTFTIFDGRNDDRFYVDFIWSVDGTIPSGKEVMKVLIEKGAITREQAITVLNAPETLIDNTDWDYDNMK